MKRTILILALLAGLTACATQSDAILAQACPGNLPQAATLSLPNANSDRGGTQSSEIDGRHSFMLAQVDPDGDTVLWSGPSPNNLHETSLQPGQPVTVDGPYVELAVFDANVKPTRHRVTLCSDSRSAWTGN